MKLSQSLIVSGNNYHDNYALDFNGSTQYIDIDGGILADFDSRYGTYMAWVNLDAISSGSSLIIKISVNSSNQVGIWMKNDGNIKAQYNGGGTARNAESEIEEDDEIEADGNYHNLIMTWDTVADEMKAYLDGVQFGGTRSSLGTWAGTPNRCRIGANSVNASATNFYNGKISEVAFFKTVQSASYLYNGGKPFDLAGTSGLIGYWKFEEGTGTAETLDTSGLNNTGTLQNSPTWTTDTPLS